MAFSRFAAEEAVRRTLKNREKPTEKQLLGLIYPEYGKLCQQHHDNKLKQLTPSKTTGEADDKYASYATLASIYRAQVEGAKPADTNQEETKGDSAEAKAKVECLTAA